MMSYSIFCGYDAISSVVILQAPTPESLAPSVNSVNWSHWLGITAPGDLTAGRAQVTRAYHYQPNFMVDKGLFIKGKESDIKVTCEERRRSGEVVDLRVAEEG